MIKLLFFDHLNLGAAEIKRPTGYPAKRKSSFGSICWAEKAKQVHPTTAFFEQTHL